jgi:hypothetical protein
MRCGRHAALLYTSVESFARRIAQFAAHCAGPAIRHNELTGRARLGPADQPPRKAWLSEDHKRRQRFDELDFCRVDGRTALDLVAREVDEDLFLWRVDCFNRGGANQGRGEDSSEKCDKARFPRASTRAVLTVRRVPCQTSGFLGVLNSYLFGPRARERGSTWNPT